VAHPDGQIQSIGQSLQLHPKSRSRTRAAGRPSGSEVSAQFFPLLRRITQTLTPYFRRVALFHLQGLYTRLLTRLIHW
jgi:hypothetical protein